MGDAALKDNSSNEMQEAFKDAKREEQSIFDMKLDNLDMGKPETLRYNVLNWVLNEKYDRAIEALKNCVDEDSEYPDFKEKAVRYLNHCIDLVYAIKAKRNFPGMNSLTRSKQQELKEKFKIHLRELQSTLMRIEMIRHDLRIKDVRSTIYVVKALWIAGLCVIMLAFFMEMIHGLASTSTVVFGDLTDQATNWLFSLIGL